MKSANKPVATAQTRPVFLFLATQLLSMVGSKVSHVAMGFWLYAETKSVLSLSIVLFLSFLPNVLGSFVAGPINDRMSFRSVFGVGDLLSAIVMVTSAAIFYLGIVSLPVIYITIFIVSLISAFQWVALNTYLPGVLTGDDLIRADAWVGTASSLASILAPSLAGILMIPLGLKGIFIFDALTFLASGALVFLALPAELKSKASKESSFLKDFQNGFSYLRTQKEIFAIVIAFVIFNFFAGINTNLTTPIFLERYNSQITGYLLGAISVGSVLAGLLQSYRPAWVKKVTNVPVVMALALILNIGVGIFWNSLLVGALLTMVGVLLSVMSTVTSLAIQNQVASEFRGRVFATARGFSWFFIPFSQIFVGVVSDKMFPVVSGSISKGMFLSNIFWVVNSIGSIVLLYLSYRHWAIGKDVIEGSVQDA